MVNKYLIKGQSLFEVMVTLMIVSLVITAIAGMALLSIKSSNYSKNKTLATRYLQEANEWLRGEKEKGWKEFSDIVNLKPSLCLNTLIWDQLTSCPAGSYIAGTSFVREVIFTPDVDIKAEVNIYWTDSGGVHEINSITYFSNW